MSGSYVINDSRTENQRNSARQNLLQDTSSYYSQDAQSLNQSATHNLEVRFEFTPDSTQNWVFSTSLNYVKGSGTVNNL